MLISSSTMIYHGLSFDSFSSAGRVESYWPEFWANLLLFFLPCRQSREIYSLTLHALTNELTKCRYREVVTRSSLGATNRIYVICIMRIVAVLDEDEDDISNFGPQAKGIRYGKMQLMPTWLKTYYSSYTKHPYSTKAANNINEDGVITYARTYNDFDVLTWYNSKGDIVSQSAKRILQTMACTIKEPCLPAQDVHPVIGWEQWKGIKNENTNVGGILVVDSALSVKSMGC